MRSMHSCPNHLPNALPPNTITLGGKTLTYEFGGMQTFSLEQCRCACVLRKDVMWSGVCGIVGVEAESTSWFLLSEIICVFLPKVIQWTYVSIL